MKKIIAKLIENVYGFWCHFVSSFKRSQNFTDLEQLLIKKINDVLDIESKYDKKMSTAPVVYTMVRSYNSETGDKVFWPWVKNVLMSEEYKYLLFTMRENVIREMVQASDPAKMHEISGQLKMLQILDAYLARGLTQYEFEQTKNKV